MVYLVQDFISFHAEKNSEKLMIQDGKDSITYGEMGSYTNRFAQFLAIAGCKRRDKIALYMEKSIDSFKGLIGILKADGVYIPLDYNSPSDRNRFMLKDCECNCIVSNAKGFPKIMDLLKGFERKIKIIILVPIKTEELLSELEKKANELPESVDVYFADGLDEFKSGKINYSNIDIDLAYIIYTSGSTGTPKGVMISHRSIIDYATWTVDYFKVNPSDRLSSHAKLHFDLSVFDLYTAFKSGASLHIVPSESSMFPVKFLEFVEEQKLTIWCSVPSFLTYVAKSGVLKKDRIPTLRAITFCGEVMPTKTIIEWMRTYPKIRYVNQYGPTETTCASMYYEIKALPEDASVPIPIGKAIPNSEPFAVNEGREQLKPGETGELFIRGVGNSHGYWNNAKRTEKVFIQNPLINSHREIVYATGDLVRLRADGLYDFLGRKDSQLKFMGYRVEPGDIEGALDSLNFISSSAVVGVNDPGLGGLLIVAFLTLREQVSVSLIKESLEKKLPSYMIPKKFIVLEKMPLNQNGKIDRLNLKQKYFNEKDKFI